MTVVAGRNRPSGKVFAIEQRGETGRRLIVRALNLTGAARTNAERAATRANVDRPSRDSWTLNIQVVVCRKVKMRRFSRMKTKRRPVVEAGRFHGVAVFDGGSG